MGIFQRISDIVSANFNDLLEGYEDPEKMLRQAIREMETAISHARPDVARSIANTKTLGKELASNEAECEAWAGRAQRAVDAGDDDLARKAIGRRLDYDKIVAALRDQHAAAEEASGTLRRQLEGMQAKLKEAERRLGTLTARKRAADVRLKMAQSQSASTAQMDQDAFHKFDRLSRKVEQAEAEAEAMAELVRSDRPLGLNESTMPCAADVAIEAELLQLKRQLQIPQD